MSLVRQVSLGGQTAVRPLHPPVGASRGLRGPGVACTGLERERRAQTGLLLGLLPGCCGPSPGAPNPLLPCPGPQLAAPC